MAAPLSSAVPASQAVKVEDEGNINIALSGEVHRDQCYKDVRNQVQRVKDLIKSQRATGRAQSVPPPLVQHPPPPPPAPAHRTWTKRPATGPPPGFAGFRQPPQKQHHPQPPRQRAQHAPQPAPNAYFTLPPSGMPPVNTSKPPLHPRYSAELFAAQRAAAAKKPSVVCGVCDVRCTSVFNLKQHEQGRKHRDKVASVAGEKNVQCQVCNVQLASELNVVQHYAGKQHRRLLQLRGANGATGNQTT